MSATESGSAKTGLVWWSKLALWILVLVFGALYLGSVKRNARVDVPAPAAAPASIPVPEVLPPVRANLQVEPRRWPRSPSRPRPTTRPMEPPGPSRPPSRCAPPSPRPLRIPS